MPDNVELRYLRDGETYTGNLQARIDGERHFHEFSNWSFQQMLLEASKLLNACPDVGITLFRLESPSLQPFSLDRKTVDLLRRDPLMAARLMTPGPVTVDLRVDSKKRRDRWDGKKPNHRAVEYVQAPIRAGYDTLADAFGEEIYVRVKGDKLEHPFHGRLVKWEFWNSCGKPGLPPGTATIPGDTASMQPVFKVVNERWATTPTGLLLQIGKATCVTRYYLPRVWNTYGPWIDHADLEQQYKKYMEEKRCSEKMQG